MTEAIASAPCNDGARAAIEMRKRVAATPPQAVAGDCGSWSDAGFLVNAAGLRHSLKRRFLDPLFTALGGVAAAFAALIVAGPAADWLWSMKEHDLFVGVAFIPPIGAFFAAVSMPGNRLRNAGLAVMVSTAVFLAFLVLWFRDARPATLAPSCASCSLPVRVIR